MIGGGFGQNAYSDDTARYDYTANVAFNTELGPHREGRSGENTTPFQVRANYLKLKPTGYTPFSFDFLAPNEFMRVTGIFQHRAGRVSKSRAGATCRMDSARM